MICKICGQEVKNKGITSHLRKHKMSDKEYYDMYVKIESEGICKVCGKHTKFFGNISGYGTYCGNKCAVHDPKVWKKAVHTMKKNGNYSRLEDKLEQFFKDNNIDYTIQYKDKRYPFHCDFYLPKTDTFIEINGYWHHRDHFYDKNNVEDVNIVKQWTKLSKTKPQYRVALEVWTIRDVQKYEVAKKNKLNYIVLWNKTDVENYITNQIID